VRADCAAFGDAVYEFGRLAGECFAAVQGGPFGTVEAAELVRTIRNLGVPGVGQSSWGPTVFAITRGEIEASRLIEKLRERVAACEYEFTIARPNNSGAQLSTKL
jgi:predicted sugar kinase